MERAVRHFEDVGQERGKGADRGALGRAFVAPDEHHAQARVDGVQEQGGLEQVLSDQGAERENGRTVFSGHFNSGSLPAHWPAG